MREQHFLDELKPCLNQIRAYTSEEDSKESQKEWGKKNKERIAGYKKEHYKKNKERIVKQRGEKVECDNCGRTCRRSDMVRHKRTKVCMSYNE